MSFDWHHYLDIAQSGIIGLFEKERSQPGKSQDWKPIQKITSR